MAVDICDFLVKVVWGSFHVATPFFTCNCCTAPFIVVDYGFKEKPMFKRYAEIADQTVSNLVNLAPKAPTPAECIDAALQANKLWAKIVEESLATLTKGVYNFK
jgi:hypothetical protein